VLLSGRIVESGGPELALELEAKGYDFIRVRHGETPTGKD
jgi:Fe-S cluster assembly ATP-binding protein